MSAVKNVIRDNYNMMLLHDYLKSSIKEAGFSHAEISKTPTGTRIGLHVTRPGIVIGRKGTGIKELTERLEVDFGLKNPQVSVVEIETPELSPSVMCNRMAAHLERGTAFRRATMWTLNQVMENGAMGVQITVSGKLRGDRSAFEKHTAGVLPRAGHHAEIIVDEDVAHVNTPMGLIGVRIRIAHKERKSPEFEMKQAAEIAANTEARRQSRQKEDEERKAQEEKQQQQQQQPEAGAAPDAAKTDAASDTADSNSGDDGDTAKTDTINPGAGSDGAVDAAAASAETETATVPGEKAPDSVTTESEHIIKEEKRMEEIDTMEDEEARFK